MNRFTSPLDDLRVASPCPANWDEMYGNERKRFCASCKLNVYNLSQMTKAEAEQFLINSEGRVCVRFYRRADGTILTENCPVGWQAVKRRVSRVATAAFSVVAGFFGGLTAFSLFRPDPPVTMGSIAITDAVIQGKPAIPIRSNDYPAVGQVVEIGDAVQGEIPVSSYTVGRAYSPIRDKEIKPKRK